MQELKKYFITIKREYQEGDVAVLRQKFSGKDVVNAVLYSTALGVYEAEINGKKVGEQMFAPGYTYYPRRVLYQEHDVTGLLHTECKSVESGDGEENELVVYLGQGWYCGRFLCENQTQIYGEKPVVSWMLCLKLADGSEKLIHSGTDVEELESPYEYAGEYDGEIYYADGRNNVVGHPVDCEGKLDFALEKTLTEVRVQEEMPVKAVTASGDRTILDFGQNFAGIVEIDPDFLHDETLTIRHGEILNPDGSLYTANLRKAKATIVYHAGTEKKRYRPRFTYMGFRYVEISGAEYKPGMIKAYALYTDMKRTGFFACEHEKVQKLYENQVWGQKSNYVEVPTDCPQRDERMGYTGDGQVFALTGAYNFDTNDFWKNFLRDLELGQLDNSEGYVCATVPQTGPAGIGFVNMLGWGNAVTILPEMMYWQFGDEEALPTQYESMKKFVEAEIRKMEGKNLWLGVSLGDWLALGKDMAWQAQHNNPISNSFIVHDLKVISETAKALGLKEDAERYEAQYLATRDAYMQMFVKEDGVVADDYQSAYIMALKFVIPEGELRRKVLKKYAENVRKEGLTTGFFATEHLLPMLIEAGETELAYDILLQEECPGWMYQINRGATTTWERWDAIREDGTVNEDKITDDNMVSFNHYAFGSVGEFYYQYILGIKPLVPGFRKIKIQPYPDKRLGGVSGSYLSRAGEIKSTWKYEGDKLMFTVVVPTEAEIHLPDGREEKVGKGEYSYELFL
ncbi:MAG: glycoside hydrolase family 78 protein [Blautia sp.]|nr:glycoside hydrolase family 78 protein [Lachnoclostridium sp.]MCM1211491.1 glycoside hydrolase family 78 protein [Blautia sp.]